MDVIIPINLVKFVYFLTLAAKRRRRVTVWVRVLSIRLSVATPLLNGKDRHRASTHSRNMEEWSCPVEY